MWHTCFVTSDSEFGLFCLEAELRYIMLWTSGVPITDLHVSITMRVQHRHHHASAGLSSPRVRFIVLWFMVYG